MIVEISAELLVEMLRTDNVVHALVLDGIPKGYDLVHIKITEYRTIELWLESETDKTEDRKPIMLRNLLGR